MIFLTFQEHTSKFEKSQRVAVSNSFRLWKAWYPEYLSTCSMLSTPRAWGFLIYYLVFERWEEEFRTFFLQCIHNWFLRIFPVQNIFPFTLALVSDHYSKVMTTMKLRFTLITNSFEKHLSWKIFPANSKLFLVTRIILPSVFTLGTSSKFLSSALGAYGWMSGEGRV